MDMGVTYLICLLLLTSVVCDDDGVTRQLTPVLNPGCAEQLNQTTCDSHHVMYVNATSASDTLHLLVSLWDAPSCLLLRTPPGASVHINWTGLVSNTAGAVTADNVLSAYGISVDELIEFDDPEDSADLFHANATQRHRLRDLDLGSGTLTVSSNGSSLVQFRLESPPLNSTGLGSAGTVTVTYEVLNSNRRTEELPHLQQTGDSIVAGVVLRGLKTKSGFKHSRFGVQLSTVGNETQKLAESKSLDDEYTPGVFKLVSLDAVAAAGGGYLQWRPVAYTDPEYTIEHSTTARHYNVSAAGGTVDSPLLHAFFTHKPLIHQLPITFGLSEDGWYKASYAAWEMTVGLGAPPKDEFSLMVILLLGIGLGLPTVALLGGGVWMAVRRIRGGGSDPSRLLVNEE